MASKESIESKMLSLYDILSAKTSPIIFQTFNENSFGRMKKSTNYSMILAKILQPYLQIFA